VPHTLIVFEFMARADDSRDAAALRARWRGDTAAASGVAPAPAPTEAASAVAPRPPPRGVLDLRRELPR